MMETSIALAVLAIVVLFCQRRFIMNSMEVSLTIPTQVEIENALVFGSRLYGPEGRHIYLPHSRRLAELVLSVRFELSVSRSLTQFLCDFYAFWPFWMFPSCTRYVSHVGIKIRSENFLK